MSFEGPNAVNTTAATAVQMETGDDLLARLGQDVLTRAEMEVVMRLVSDNGGEQFRSTIMDMSATSSGKLPSYMKEGAEGVDQSMARLSGSREYDISSSARINEEDRLGPSNIEITRAYVDLTEAGVPPQELDKTLNESEVLNPMGVISAMANLAVLHGVAGVNWDVEDAARNNQVQEVSAVYEQQMAATVTPANELDPYAVNGVSDPGLQGPTSPTRT